MRTALQKAENMEKNTGISLLNKKYLNRCAFLEMRNTSICATKLCATKSGKYFCLLCYLMKVRNKAAPKLPAYSASAHFYNFYLYRYHAGFY